MSCSLWLSSKPHVQSVGLRLIWHTLCEPVLAVKGGKFGPHEIVTMAGLARSN